MEGILQGRYLFNSKKRTGCSFFRTDDFSDSSIECVGVCFFIDVGVVVDERETLLMMVEVNSESYIYVASNFIILIIMMYYPP